MASSATTMETNRNDIHKFPCHLYVESKLCIKRYFTHFLWSCVFLARFLEVKIKHRKKTYKFRFVFFSRKGLDGGSVYCNTLTHGKKTTIYLIKRILIPFLRSAKSSHHDGGNGSGNNNFIHCIPKMYCNNKENRCRIKAKQKVCFDIEKPRPYLK